MKIFKRILIVLVFLLVISTAGIGTFYYLYVSPFMEKMKKTTVIPYDKDLTIVLGGGGNTGILVSDSLVLVIDTKMDDAATMIDKKVKQLAGSKPILVVNTHYHPDHSQGNQYFKGHSILAGGNYTREFWEKEAGTASLPNVWLKDRLDVTMGDETVTILNLGKNTHTASDVVVYLHKRKMLFGGDVILNQQAPFIRGAADPDAYLEAFDELPKKFEIEKIVPGHGPMGGIEIIEQFKEYFNDMKSIVQDPSKKESLLAKYKEWSQIPWFMSPGATVSAFEKKAKL